MMRRCYGIWQRSCCLISAIPLIPLKMENKDGEQAIRSFCEAKEKGTPYDILIFDLGIPNGMGGEEAISEIRKIDPATKAIISSGSSESPWEGVENIEGYQAVVNKPYTIQEIDRALKQVLGK
jgi:two-component system, cell cycle sensor histidine kinase and response regulator CckA